MKLNISDAAVQGSGFEEVAGFQIEMNAKAFKVLSDTLYQDKIGSIVRELSCNAFDAHIDSGKAETPFEIHLPDAFEPYFSIRDYGAGISPDDIKTIYTSYFTSTKDQSNDSVGAFGLGSKTPFSYTDSFTVISIHKGIKTMYNAHMSKGMPAIVAYGESEKTDEPDGLEVNVSAESLDFKAFAAAVRKQLKFFPTKPTIINGEIEWDEYEPIIEVPGFTVYNIVGVANTPRWGMYNREKNNLEALFLKQGPVAYPVDFGIINQYLSSNNINKTAFYSYLENNSSSYGKGIIIDMPIGTVEVTASREGISYSDVTIRNILSKFEAISKLVFKDVARILDEAYDEGNAAFVKKMNGLDSYFKSSLRQDDMEKRYDRFAFYHGSNLTPRLKLDDKFEDTEIRRYDLKNYAKPKVISNFTLTVDEDAKEDYIPFNIDQLVELGVVYVKDVNTNFVARIDNDTTENYCVNRYAILIELPDGLTAKDLRKALGDGIAVHNVSDLEEVKINRKSTGGNGHSITGGRNRLWFEVNRRVIERGMVAGYETLYALSANQHFGESFKDEVEDGDKYVYFVTYNNKVDSNKSGVPFGDDELDKQSLFATWLRDKGYNIVAIPANSITKAEKTGAFISYGDAWTQHKKAFINDQWDMFGKCVIRSYYKMVNEKVYNSATFHARRTMKNVMELMDETGIKDHHSIRAKFEQAMQDYEENYQDYSLNGAIGKFISDSLPASKMKLYNELSEDYMGYAPAGQTLKGMERLMDKAGFKPKYKLSTLLEQYADIVKKHIHKLIAMSYVKMNNHNGWSLSCFTVINPVNGAANTGESYLSTDDMLKAISRNMKDGS